MTQQGKKPKDKEQDECKIESTLVTGRQIGPINSMVIRLLTEDRLAQFRNADSITIQERECNADEKDNIWRILKK